MLAAYRLLVYRATVSLLALPRCTHDFFVPQCATACFSGDQITHICELPTVTDRGPGPFVWSRQCKVRRVHKSFLAPPNNDGRKHGTRLHSQHSLAIAIGHAHGANNALRPTPMVPAGRGGEQACGSGGRSSAPTARRRGRSASRVLGRAYRAAPRPPRPPAAPRPPTALRPPRMLRRRSLPASLPTGIPPSSPISKQAGSKQASKEGRVPPS